MKKALVIVTILVLLSGRSLAQQDSLQANRYVTRATMYGVGFTNVFDSYLSPVEYTGIDLRLSRETIRMTNLFHGNVSLQNFFQANLSYADNPTETNTTFAGLVNWNYGLHYQFRINEHLKLLAGGMGQLNGGFVYNLRNSNNPASAKASANLAASGMLLYHFNIKNRSFVFRYQVNAPLVGVLFSPNYGQSYYEIFSLGNHHNVIKFASLNNQRSLFQQFSFDFPIGYTKMRVSYVWDIQQTDVNRLKTHTYSHVFMIGFVHDLFRIKKKGGNSLSPKLRAY